MYRSFTIHAQILIKNVGNLFVLLILFYFKKTYLTFDLATTPAARLINNKGKENDERIPRWMMDAQFNSTSLRDDIDVIPASSR